MNFASVRLVTQKFEELVQFYQDLSTVEATHLAEGFAQIQFNGVILALCDERLVRLHNDGVAVAASNRSAILEFQVADVAAVLERMPDADVAMPITLMPWGNTSLLIRDPDGSLINIFSRPLG